MLREHIPLEQGLRPCEWQNYPFPRLHLREHIPLEQGLRRHFTYLAALLDGP